MNILREKSDEGARIRQACESHTSKLIQLGLSHNIEDVYQNQTMADVQFRVIEVVHLLAKYRPDYLNNQHLLLDHLKNIWMNPTFRQRFKSIPPPTPAPVNYREAILIGRIFLITVETNSESVEYLFQLQRINQMRTLAQFGKIKFFFFNHVTKKPVQSNLIFRDLMIASLDGVINGDPILSAVNVSGSLARFSNLIFCL